MRWWGEVAAALCADDQAMINVARIVLLWVGGSLPFGILVGKAMKRQAWHPTGDQPDDHALALPSNVVPITRRRATS